MIKKAIIALIFILAIVGLAFAANSMNTKNSTNTTNSTINTTNTTTNTTNSTNPFKQINVTATKNTSLISQKNKTLYTISPAEARNIADTYIQVSGAIAGTPKLVYQSNKLVYIVPVMENGTNVGEIDIDAQNGHNLGGAGGAP
jgi:Flp pilus assembly protein TadG